MRRAALQAAQAIHSETAVLPAGAAGALQAGARRATPRQPTLPDGSTQSGRSRTRSKSWSTQLSRKICLPSRQLGGRHHPSDNSQLCFHEKFPEKISRKKNPCIPTWVLYNGISYAPVGGGWTARVQPWASRHKPGLPLQPFGRNARYASQLLPIHWSSFSPRTDGPDQIYACPDCKENHGAYSGTV